MARRPLHGHVLLHDVDDSPFLCVFLALARLFVPTCVTLVSFCAARGLSLHPVGPHGILSS